MKKIIIPVLLLLMLSFTSSSKPLVVIKTTVKGYYHGLIDSTSLQNRTRFDLAKDDVQNYLIANGGGTGYVQAPYWQIDVTVNKSDTTTTVKPFEPYFKDTTFYAKQANKIFDSVTNARYFSILYLPDSSKRHVKMISILAKDSIPKPLNCTECGVKDIKIKFRTFYDSPEEVRRVELEHEYISIVVDTFRIVEFAIRSQDATGTSTQTYATEDWIFSKRTGNTMETLSEWQNMDEYTPGSPENYVVDGVTYPLLRRHSQFFNTKFFQVRAISRRTGKIDYAEIINNPFIN